MITFRHSTVGALVLGAIFAASPALAQKGKDMLRFVTEEPFSHLDHYQTGGNQVGFLARAVYGRLALYDEYKGQFIPELAKSWKRVDPTTLEFELRDDISFHTGNKFTADDVKYTLDFLKNPEVKLREKTRYTWMKSIEKLGPHKLRIVTTEPYIGDMQTIAARYFIYDSKVHQALKDPRDYGRINPSTTGVYKVVSIDENKGTLFERFEPATKWYTHTRAPIRFIQTVPVTDRQTQLAQLLTNNVDVVRNITADIGTQLQSNPNIAVTPSSSRIILYINLDAAGRSDNKIFTDLRIRQALIKAIPRDVIVKNFIPGANMAVLPQAICYPQIEACAYSTEPVGYDPAGAKRLLAEAGHPDGFDMELTVGEPFREIAAAVAGELRKVGIRATVNPMLTSLIQKARPQGKLTALMSTFVAFAQPTATNVMDFFFREAEDYAQDPVITDARIRGETEFDLEKRTAIYRKAIDRVNEMSYVYPMSELPIVFAHSKDVRLEPNLVTVAEIRITDFFWK
jgi:peptide/nickel transport system substrate-binding protein